MSDRRSEGLADFQPQAEAYAHHQIPSFTERHPDAPSRVSQNTLIIGSAGTGKSMVMRQLCSAYEDSDDVFPLYVHAEFWLARALAESASSSPNQSTLATRRTHTYANALLGLAVVERLVDIGHFDVASASARTLYGAPSFRNDADLLEWIDSEAGIIGERVRSQAEPTGAHGSLPRLPDIFEQFGKIVGRIMGKRLLLLVDQLDKVSPTYFTILGSALGRSTNYVLCVATRPSVCAPEETLLNTRVGDYGVFWLGGDWASGKWRDFLMAAAARHFSNTVCGLLGEAIDSVANLVGPSTREFLFIGDRLKELVDRGEDPRRSLSEAVTNQVSSFQGVLGSSLSEVKMFDQFRMKLEDHVRGASNSAALTWPSHLQIGPDGQAAFVRPHTLSFLRMAIREGMLVPKDVLQFGLDGLSLEYQIIPMAVVSPQRALQISSKRGAPRFVSESDLKRWANPSWGSALPKQPTPSVFYSHWMDERNEVSPALIEDLSRGLRPAAVVTTGKAELSGNQRTGYVDRIISDQIRAKIKDALMVVVQLDPLRLAIGIELGWALSLGKPCRLVVASPAEIAYVPNWLRIIELDFNGVDSSRHAFIADIVLNLDQIMSGAEKSHYLAVGDTGETIRSGTRQLTSTLVVGSGVGMSRISQQLRDAFGNQGLAHPDVDDTSNVGAGGRVAELVARARRTGTLVVVLSGDQQSDILAAIALGAFTFQDSDKSQRPPGVSGTRTVSREVVLLDLSGRTDNYVPRSMTGGLSGLFYTTDIHEARDRIVANRLKLQTQTSPVRSPHK